MSHRKLADSPITQAAELRARWKEIAGNAKPSPFPSDVARELGVSEGELLSSRVGYDVHRLRPEWNDLLASLSALGTVRTVTRNRHAVIEKVGRYPKFEPFRVNSMFVGKDIDLRLVLAEWSFALAVETPGGKRGTPVRGLQFFGHDGSAKHKLFLREESDTEQFYELIARFRHEDQSVGHTLAPVEEQPAPTQRIDRAAFLAGWERLEETHHFFTLLREHGLTRPQAMALAEGRFTRRVSITSARSLIEAVSAARLPVLIFVGNPGCLQIHKGVVRNTADWQGWFNVLDSDFELHLQEAGIADAWVVERPTSAGPIRSLELFDAEGRDIASIFGVRRQGRRQSEAWTDLVGALPDRATGEGE